MELGIYTKKAFSQNRKGRRITSSTVRIHDWVNSVNNRVTEEAVELDQASF